MGHRVVQRASKAVIVFYRIRGGVTVNSAALAAVASSVAALIMVLGVVFVAGKLSKEVQTNTSDIASHKVTIDGHAVQLASHDSQIARLEGWKEGYKAGSHDAGGGD